MATRNSLWYRIRQVFNTSLHESEVSAATAIELRDNRETVSDLRKKVLQLETEVRLKDSEIKVLDHEKKCLAAVIERDRLRVQAETATFASTVARHTGLSPTTED